MYPNPASTSESTVSLHMRFWKHVAKGESEDDCWRWLIGANIDGYGLISEQANGHNYQHIASRVSYQLAYGDLASEDCVVHSCDNPPCCNYRHLSKGTRESNIADRHARGRDARGVGSGVARFTEEQIRDIRRRVVQGESLSSVGRLYSASHTHIRDIATRKIWAHIQ